MGLTRSAHTLKKKVDFFFLLAVFSPPLQQASDIMDDHEQVEYNYITSRLFQNPKLRENITKYLIETKEYYGDNITPVVKSRKRCHGDTENVPPKSLFGSDKDVVTQAAQSGGENHYSVNTNNAINNFITLSGTLSLIQFNLFTYLYTC